jgi:peptidoglycan-N-acetylglucosamine deacetylase
LRAEGEEVRCSSTVCFTLRVANLRSPLLCLLLLTALGGCTAKKRHVKTAPRHSPAVIRVREQDFRVHLAGQYVAMTFDDGPDKELTPKLLDLLAADHIKATFFVVGEKVAQHPAIVSRAAREGHEIGNHSWSHPILSQLPDQNVREELQKTEDAIFVAAGACPRLMRPPGGELTEQQARWIRNDFGYEIVHWSVDPRDYMHPGPAVVCQRILERTHPGSIILCHDVHPGTIDAMRSLFPQLQAEGFKFVTVSKLIRLAAREHIKQTGARHHWYSR